MNIDKDIRDELIELMKKSINHYNSFKHYKWVVKPAIPILFFGNVIEYLNSDIKMITVALNPSDKEFPKDGTRFSFCPDKLNKGDAIKVLDTLNEYFKFNPYDDWFDRFTEKIMNKMNVSYYSNKGFINRALNTDLCTPIATNPTWDGLVNNKKTRIPNDLSDELKKQGFKIWLELIKILKPNVILISLAKEYLTSNNFVEKTILKNNENIETTFSYDDVQNKDVKDLGRKNITYFTHNKIPDCKIYLGINNGGTPFRNISYSETDLVSDLIIKHMKE